MSVWRVPVSLPIALSWAPPPPLNHAVICWETLGGWVAAGALVAGWLALAVGFGAVVEWLDRPPAMPAATMTVMRPAPLTSIFFFRLQRSFCGGSVLPGGALPIGVVS